MAKGRARNGTWLVLYKNFEREPGHGEQPHLLCAHSEKIGLDNRALIISPDMAGIVGPLARHLILRASQPSPVHFPRASPCPTAPTSAIDIRPRRTHARPITCTDQRQSRITTLNRSTYSTSAQVTISSAARASPAAVSPASRSRPTDPARPLAEETAARSRVRPRPGLPIESVRTISDTVESVIYLHTARHISAPTSAQAAIDDTRVMLLTPDAIGAATPNSSTMAFMPLAVVTPSATLPSVLMMWSSCSPLPSR